ncbi:MAG: LysR substrate-binding domain-containing protein, partial [Anaerolineales bacterium]|nr:LysR substrate-binding domain-containing protein [Anaerolineales bacterium]
MTLDQLRTFCAVARLKSFSRAADALNLTQPAVSTQIAALEREYRVALFHRTSKGVCLTEAGEIVLASAKEILRVLEETRQSLDALQGLARGKVNLGASLIAGIYVLPRILGEFKLRHPEIEINLQVEHALEIAELIVANNLELGFVGEGNPIKHPHLAVKPFLNDEFLVIVSRNHRRAKSKTISVTELAAQPFIASHPESATRQVIARHLEPAGIKLNIVMQMENIEMIKKAVEANLGVSIMSKFAIQQEIETRRLHALRIAKLPLHRQMYLVWHKDRRLSKA